jgi:dTDP-4-dehydrorhamnose reductase
MVGPSEESYGTLIRMTWLITGGNGQLGTAISEELLRRGVPFKAWSSNELDVSKDSKVFSTIEKLSPRVIVNCAAWTDVDAAEANEQLASKVNSHGAGNVAIASRHIGAKLLHISTDYVFSGDSTKPWKELDEMNPRSAYGRTKADGERRVLIDYPENTSIIRTAWLYSPWGKNFVKTMVKLALFESEEVRVVNNQLGQPTSATDLAKQIIDLGTSSSPIGIFHGTNSGKTSWYELAQIIFEKVGADAGRVIPISSHKLNRAAARPDYSVLDHENWSKTSVAPLQNWKSALNESLPRIKLTVERNGYFHA